MLPFAVKMRAKNQTKEICQLTCDADVEMGVFVYQDGSQVEETGVRVRLVETHHLFDQGLEERG